MTQGPDDLIESFIGAWSAMDVDAIMEHLHDDATYHNIPMEPLVGTDAIRSFVEMFLGMSSAIDFEIVNQVITGDLVINERVDHLTMNGQEIHLPVAGVFELREGKIAAWRDYFDMGMLGLG